MLALRFDPRHFEADLSDEPDAYLGLETEVIILLCSEARVADNEVPRGMINRGWWANTVPLDIVLNQDGSRLWLLQAAGALPRSVRLAEKFAERALSPLLADKRVAGVIIVGELGEMDRINLGVTLVLPDGFQVGPIRLTW